MSKKPREITYEPELKVKFYFVGISRNSKLRICEICQKKKENFHDAKIKYKYNIWTKTGEQIPCESCNDCYLRLNLFSKLPTEEGE